jgi:hypothetical protein
VPVLLSVSGVGVFHQARLYGHLNGLLSPPPACTLQSAQMIVAFYYYCFCKYTQATSNHCAVFLAKCASNL